MTADLVADPGRRRRCSRCGVYLVLERSLTRVLVGSCCSATG